MPKEEVKLVQKELKARLRQGKEDYRRKLELKLQQNNMRDVWTGMKLIIGYKKTSGLDSSNQDSANELNLFLNRFDGGASGWYM